MLCRLYIDEEIRVGDSISIDSEQGRYLRSVMRLSAGHPVVLFNGYGGEYRGVVELLSKDESSIYVESFDDISRELQPRVHIVQAACRSEKIETVLQKATELGAASFSIIRSERSSLKLNDTKLKTRLGRWQKIIVEAAEQSGRTIVPEVKWVDKLSAIPSQGVCYYLHPNESSAWHSQREKIICSSDTTLAIGPEGGWSRRDITTFSETGFTPLMFGPRIMRTETAAPALLAAIQSLINS